MYCVVAMQGRQSVGGGGGLQPPPPKFWRGGPTDLEILYFLIDQIMVYVQLISIGGGGGGDFL